MQFNEFNLKTNNKNKLQRLRILNDKINAKSVFDF